MFRITAVNVVVCPCRGAVGFRRISGVNTLKSRFPCGATGETPFRAGVVGMLAAPAGVVGPGRAGKLGFGVFDAVVVPAGPGLTGKLGPVAVVGVGAPIGPGLMGAPVVGCGEFFPVAAVVPVTPPGPGRTGTAMLEGVVGPVPPAPIARTGAGVGGGVAVMGEEAVPELGLVAPDGTFADAGWPVFPIAFCVPVAGPGFCLGGSPTMDLGPTARVFGVAPPETPAAPGALGAGEVAADVEVLFPPYEAVWLAGREPGPAGKVVRPI